MISAEEWQNARHALLINEKRATRGERVLRSYFTTGRGVDRLRWDLSVLMRARPNAMAQARGHVLFLVDAEHAWARAFG